jgi:hypothetical protein
MSHHAELRVPKPLHHVPFPAEIGWSRVVLDVQLMLSRRRGCLAWCSWPAYSVSKACMGLEAAQLQGGSLVPHAVCSNSQVNHQTLCMLIQGGGRAGALHCQGPCPWSPARHQTWCLVGTGAAERRFSGISSSFVRAASQQ